mgnify:CR=1 FL=1
MVYFNCEIPEDIHKVLKIEAIKNDSNLETFVVDIIISYVKKVIQHGEGRV